MENFIPMTPEALLAYAAKTPPPALNKVGCEYEVKEVYPSVWHTPDPSATFKVDGLQDWASETGWRLEYEELEDGKCHKARLLHESPRAYYKVTLERLLDATTHTVHKTMESGKRFGWRFAPQGGIEGKGFSVTTSSKLGAKSRKVLLLQTPQGPAPFNLQPPPTPDVRPSPKQYGGTLKELEVLYGHRWLDMGHGVKVALFVVPQYDRELDPPSRWPQGKPCHRARAVLYMYASARSVRHGGQVGEMFVKKSVGKPNFKDEHLSTTKSKAMFLASVPPSTISELGNIKIYHNQNVTSWEIEDDTHASDALAKARALVADPSKAVTLNMGQRFRGIDLHAHIGMTKRYIDDLNNLTDK